MSDLKESLFQAIRVIAQAEDSKLSFTKTIEATIFDKTSRPFFTIAKAISSQLDSIPNVSMSFTFTTPFLVYF